MSPALVAFMICAALMSMAVVKDRLIDGGPAMTNASTAMLMCAGVLGSIGTFLIVMLAWVIG